MLEELIKEGIQIIGPRIVEGKTNLVYPATYDDCPVICKIYNNKYFTNQIIYEKHVLDQLNAEGFKVPRIIKLGNVTGKNYVLLTKLEGEQLNCSVPINYISQVNCFLSALHKVKIKISVEHPLQKNPEFLVMKALNKLNEKKLKEIYLASQLGSKGAVFCHRDPNFKHIIFKDSILSGLVDFEDSMILDQETDYASFILDQIEFKRPKREIFEFIKSYEGNPNNLAKYIARLYIIDMAFNQGTISGGKEKYIDSVFLLLNNGSIENKIDKLVGDSNDN